MRRHTEFCMPPVFRSYIPFILSLCLPVRILLLAGSRGLGQLQHDFAEIPLWHVLQEAGVAVVGLIVYIAAPPDAARHHGAAVLRKNHAAGAVEPGLVHRHVLVPSAYEAAGEMELHAQAQLFVLPVVAVEAARVLDRAPVPAQGLQLPAQGQVVEDAAAEALQALLVLLFLCHIVHRPVTYTHLTLPTTPNV